MGSGLKGKAERKKKKTKNIENGAQIKRPQDRSRVVANGQLPSTSRERMKEKW